MFPVPGNDEDAKKNPTSAKYIGNDISTAPPHFTAVPTGIGSASSADITIRSKRKRPAYAGRFFCDPKGTRTPVPTVRGWCPKPLDDRADDARIQKPAPDNRFRTGLLFSSRGGRNRTYANGFGDRCTTIIRRPPKKNETVNGKQSNRISQSIRGPEPDYSLPDTCFQPPTCSHCAGCAFDRTCSTS